MLALVALLALVAGAALVTRDALAGLALAGIGFFLATVFPRAGAAFFAGFRLWTGRADFDFAALFLRGETMNLPP